MVCRSLGPAPEFITIGENRNVLTIELVHFLESAAVNDSELGLAGGVSPPPPTINRTDVIHDVPERHRMDGVLSRTAGANLSHPPANVAQP